MSPQTAHIIYTTSLIYYLVVVIIMACVNIYMYNLTKPKNKWFMVGHFLFITFIKAPIVAPFYLLKKIFGG